MSSQTGIQSSTVTEKLRISSFIRLVERNWLRVWTGLVLLLLYTPIIVIVAFSFEKGAFSTLPWSGFTLEWYQELFASGQALNSIYNSVYVALIVTAVGTTLGTLGAIALVRQNFRGKTVFRVLVLAPMTIPGLLLGVALLMMFNFLEVTRSLRTVMIGQLVFVTPFVLVTVSSRLRGFDPALEEAARDLGASRWTVYRRITLPILAPGIISGALFAFTLSFDDFLIAFFTSGAQNTLPVYIFSEVQRNTSPVVNAISAIALIISITIVAISRYFQSE
jgi:spermidine/putrescine transport system permease protein